MSELTERLWYASERVSPSDITMEAPPRGSLKWVEIQCAEAARLIDAIDALTEKPKKFTNHAEHSGWVAAMEAVRQLIHPEDDQ